MEKQEYIDYLIDKDSAKITYADENAFNRLGKPCLRCGRCNFILDLGIEQFCPSCGQRLVEDKNDRFYNERNLKRIKERMCKINKLKEQHKDVDTISNAVNAKQYVAYVDECMNVIIEYDGKKQEGIGLIEVERGTSTGGKELVKIHSRLKDIYRDKS